MRLLTIRFYQPPPSPSKRLKLVQLAPTLDLLSSLSRTLNLPRRNLVDDPASTTSDKKG